MSTIPTSAKSPLLTRYRLRIIPLDRIILSLLLCVITKYFNINVLFRQGINPYCPLLPPPHNFISIAIKIIPQIIFRIRRIILFVRRIHFPEIILMGCIFGKEKLLLGSEAPCGACYSCRSAPRFNI